MDLESENCLSFYLTNFNLFIFQFKLVKQLLIYANLIFKRHRAEMPLFPGLLQLLMKHKN